MKVIDYEEVFDLHIVDKVFQLIAMSEHCATQPGRSGAIDFKN